MGICSICKKAIDKRNSRIIFQSALLKSQSARLQGAINLLLHSNRLIELRGAIRLLTACAKPRADPDVASALRAPL